MKFTYNWLKDFVEIKIAPEKLADKLTMAGLEVVSLEKRDSDFVFEIEVTPNRPDLLSVAGIAREVAAITGKKLRSVASRKSRVASPRRKTREARQFSIKVESKKDCPLYTAKIIKKVKVGPAPDWLRKRLELIGCRSVNNIVDITNYVQFSWGEPLHAFDLDKIVNQLPSLPVSQLNVIIRRAENREEIVTIDGIKRILNEGILVIASEIEEKTGKPANRQTGKPIAIAGIMGGKDTEVTASTQNILLEAAVFNPVVVRHSRQALGLSSESAYRFERGVNLEAVESASLCAAELIEQYCGAQCVLAKSSGKVAIKKKSIKLEVSGVQKILGVNITGAKIRQILNSLGLKAKLSRQSRNPDKSGKSKNSLGVEIPSHRPDLNLEIDLIEEIARIFGYEFIPKTLPKVAPQVTAYKIRDLVSAIKNILVGLGLDEVITYSLIDKALLRNFGNIEAIEILNPLSQEQEILRPRLLPSLARSVAYNLNQKQDYVNIFEVAKTFTPGATLPKEELSLGIALAGRKSYLFQQGVVKDEAGFLHLKGILEVIFEMLGIKDYDFVMEQGLAIYVAQEKIGQMFSLPQDTLDKLEIKNKDVFMLEISLERLLSYAQLKKKFIPLPKYPGITRDISFILKEDISIKDVFEAMKEKGEPLLSKIEIVDYYRGKQIPPGYRGLTISCLYRSEKGTLTDAEINPLHALVCSILTERFGATIR